MPHFYDDETGLPSWELFQDRLGHALVRAGRSSQALATALLWAQYVNEAGGVARDPPGWRAGIAQRLRLIMRSGARRLVRAADGGCDEFAGRVR